MMYAFFAGPWAFALWLALVLTYLTARLIGDHFYESSMAKEKEGLAGEDADRRRSVAMCHVTCVSSGLSAVYALLHVYAFKDPVFALVGGVAGFFCWRDFKELLYWYSPA